MVGDFQNQVLWVFGRSETSSLKPVVGECNHICNMCTHCTVYQCKYTEVAKSMWVCGGGVKLIDRYCGG